MVHFFGRRIIQGEMTSSITLADADGGTDLFAVHEGLPPGLSPVDNETGWRMALAKLKALVEGGKYYPAGDSLRSSFS